MLIVWLIGCSVRNPTFWCIWKNFVQINTNKLSLDYSNLKEIKKNRYSNYVIFELNNFFNTNKVELIVVNYNMIKRLNFKTLQFYYVRNTK